MIYNPAIPSLYGHKFNRIKPEMVLHVPEGTDSINTTDESPQIRVIGGQLKLYYGSEWITIGGGVEARDGVQYDSEGYLVWGGPIDVDVTLTFNGGKKLFIKNLPELANANILYYDNETGELTYGEAPVGGNIYTEDGTITDPERNVFLNGNTLIFQDGAIDMSDNIQVAIGPNLFLARAREGDGSKDGYFQISKEGIYGYAYGELGYVNFMWGNAGVDVQANQLTLNNQQGMLHGQSGNFSGFDGIKAYASTYNRPTDASIQVGVYSVFGGTGSHLMRYTTDAVYLLDGYDEFAPDPVFQAYSVTTEDITGFDVLLYDNATGAITRASTSLLGGSGGISTGNKAYYVSPSGNDTNDGLSPATAWQTITKVNSFGFIGGDTILFEGEKSFTGRIVCKGGTAGNRITYGSYGSGRATIIGNNLDSIDVTNISYVTVRDLICQGINHTLDYWGAPGISITAGYSTAGYDATNISFINLKVDGFASWHGIATYTEDATCSISNVLIEGCEVSGCMNGIVIDKPDAGTVASNINFVIRNCKVYNNFGSYNYSTNWTGSGIVMLFCTNSVIEECEAYGNGWNNGSAFGGPHGIWVAESSGCTIRNCESHHNGTGTVGGRRIDGGGFDIDGGCQNCVIEYCYSHDNAGCGYALFEYGSPRAAFTGNVIRYCISVADCRLSDMGGFTIWTAESGFTNNRIHNNLVIIDSNKIIASITPPAVKFMGGTYNTLNIVNNIFIVDGSGINLTAGTVGGTWANNITYATNGATLNYSTGCTVANPLLVNHTMEPPTIGAWAQKGVRGSCWNYQLSVNSPAINTGTSTISGYTFPTRDFWGIQIGGSSSGARNIGPHELLIPS